jgi:hypothetical protein
MRELARALFHFANQNDECEVAQYAKDYLDRRPSKEVGEQIIEAKRFAGYVYLQKHGADYKIGFTNSLNKRGRQIQIELPQETELVNSILTDDPRGVEAYWHKRFEDKRTRGEWFKLSKSDVAAFKRWSKIW